MTDLTKPVKPETNEIATIARDITYPAFAGVLREQDDTLLTRGRGLGLKLYDDIERDCTVYGNLQKRKLAIISRPWQVVPASDSPLDMRAADVVRRQLSSESLNFDNICLRLLPAILKGFAVGEIMWGVVGSEIAAIEVRPRDQRRFGFDDQYALRLKTQDNFLPGIELPDRKFIVHSFGSDSGNPFGLGLGSRLFWPAFFKRKGITFWLTFIDKFASPTPVGEYPVGTSAPDQDKLLASLNALSQNAGVVIPQGMIVRLMEAARSGEAGYEMLCHYMDEQITLAILGEAPSVKGGGGQAASAAVTRNEVRLELVKADSDLLSATLNRTLVKWISEYNVPGATPPRVWRKVEEQKDLGAVATRDKTIFDMGFRPTLAYITETYGGEWMEVATPPPAGRSAGVIANFSESGVTDPTATEEGVLAVAAAESWGEMISAVKSAVDDSADLTELQNKLTAAYGALPTDNLVRIMAAGFALAELKGMADAG
jgi:phage gp29-like protein